MALFDNFPTYGRYRVLRLADPMMAGEDVFALQTALSALGGADPGVHDGILGAKTAAAIKAAQKALSVTVDGLAGGQTQTALVHVLADRARTKHNLPVGLAFGQLTHESSCRVGNYSAQRDDGSYDAGVAQRNTLFTSPLDGFNVPESIDALGANLRRYFDKFQGVPSTRRKWELAAGAWNAPAYACWIAKQENAQRVSTSETTKPSDAARAALEEYMDKATAFMVLS